MEQMCCGTEKATKILAELDSEKWVRIRYKQLTYGKIEALLLDLNDVTWTIRNKTPYLISALYNAANTGETSITNRVKRDMYGGGM